MARLDVEFRSGNGSCSAWLYRPEPDGRVPLVVMAHGFSATRDQRLDAYAERFQAAGLAVLLFDYRNFGASPGEPRQLLSIRRQHADFHSAIAYARGLDDVDPDRIALVGSSFSGGHVLAVGAADPRIAGIVSQCPFTDGLASLPKLGVANIAKATGAGLRDLLSAATGREPVYVPAVGPQGSFAMMTSRDAQPGLAAITGPDSLWENRVAARIGLTVGSYRPGRAAAGLHCPVLFCVCDKDALAPAATTLRYASRAPHGEIKRYPIGHFDIYVGADWERAVTDQTEFLTRVLGVAGRTGVSSAAVS